MRIYAIIETSKITNKIVSDCIGSTKDTYRLSNDGLKALLSYNDSKPSSLGNIKTYTHSEIKEEMRKEEWIYNEQA